MRLEKTRRQLELALGDADTAGASTAFDGKTAFATLALARAVIGVLQLAVELDDLDNAD